MVINYFFCYVFLAPKGFKSIDKFVRASSMSIHLQIFASMKHSLPSPRYLPLKVLVLPSALIGPLCLCTQAIQPGSLITFVYTSLLIAFVCVFYFSIFSNKLYLNQITCCFILLSTVASLLTRSSANKYASSLFFNFKVV